MQITPFRPEDRTRWGALWTGYLSFYHTSLPAEIFDSTWARLLNGEINGLGLRGTDGVLQGITHYMFHPTAWNPAPLCYLQDLYVDPAGRGTGGGRALIEAVAEAARARGSFRLYWLTQQDNDVARQLYDRLAKHNGFIRYDYTL